MQASPMPSAERVGRHQQVTLRARGGLRFGQAQARARMASRLPDVLQTTGRSREPDRAGHADRVYCSSSPFHHVASSSDPRITSDLRGGGRSPRASGSGNGKLLHLGVLPRSDGHGLHIHRVGEQGDGGRNRATRSFAGHAGARRIDREVARDVGPDRLNRPDRMSRRRR